MNTDTFKHSAATWDSDQGRLNTAKTVARAIKNTLPFKVVNYAMDYGCGTGLVSFELLPIINGVLAIADLKKEDGDFHSDNSGVHHFGFDPDDFKSMLKEIGFHNISYKTIHTIKKETNKNKYKEFPVFLINAVK